jgi:hypothetical protein
MKNLWIPLVCVAFMFACAKPEEKPVVVEEPKPTPDLEIAESRYTEVGKKAIAAMSAGDIDGWTADYADNAKYYWSGGDSLIGKPAIIEYWKDRRAKVVDSITFSNDIWMPVKVNRSQRGPDLPGVWLFGWYFTSIKYKNNQKVSMWIHSDMHFDANDKIDMVIQYIDRAPINAALAKKK